MGLLFDWDNIQLIKTSHFEKRMVKRNISMNSVIELFKNPKLIYRKKLFPKLRYLIIGDAFGNILEIVLEHKNSNVFYLLTIFEASDSHKKLYRRKVN